VKVTCAVLAALILAACSSSSPTSAPPASTAAPDPATLARVSGTVVVDGTVPPPRLIRLDGDPKCVALANGAERRAEDVLVGDGNTLQNVFVYVKDGLPLRMYPLPAEPVVLDQQQCRYVPRVVGVQVGQQVIIKNSDPLLHNVRAEGAINEPFDVGTPVQGVEIARTFVTREVMVPFKCNVHAWMNAYVGVLEHPYFSVTDQSGRFSLPPLPAGTYTIEIWHEKFGTQTQQVTVSGNDTKDLTFTYKAS
jgi:plastocyanin